MSMLHSLYAFGVFTIVVVSTLFLKLFGAENWMFLTMFLGLLPVIAAVLFMTSPMPEMHMEERIPGIGVTAYAMMAAGGDLGTSIAPQRMGIVVDHVSASAWAAEMSTVLQLTTEQIGLKAGMLVTSVFPILGALLLLGIIAYFRKTAAQNKTA